MHTRTGLIATVFAAAALLGACGTPGSQPGPAQPGQGGCRSGPVQVTDADNGKTLCVTTGSSVDVLLVAPDKTMAWAPVESDSAALVPLKATGPVGPAGVTSAAFTAEHAGTVRLSSNRAVCPGHAPGMQCHAVQGFTVTVTVE